MASRAVRLITGCRTDGRSALPPLPLRSRCTTSAIGRAAKVNEHEDLLQAVRRRAED